MIHNKARIRLAAVADIHCTRKTVENTRNLLSAMANGADIILLGGDLCDTGLPEEAEVLARELTAVRTPAVAVLGNHDFEAGKGFRTETTFSHWLAKVYHEDSFIDIIFSSGNGLCEVDDLWFEHARAGEAFGFPVNFCFPEEMIWSKAFVMERERYDGGDIAHLLLECGAQLVRKYLAKTL